MANAPKKTLISRAKSNTNESIIHYLTSYRLQRFHDFRLVWPAQTARCRPEFKGLASDSHHLTVLGHSIVRVLFHDSCQPHRIHHQRRPIQLDTAESHPRSHFTHRVHHHRHHGVQNRDFPLEPHRFFPFHHISGVFCVQKMKKQLPRNGKSMIFAV